MWNTAKVLLRNNTIIFNMNIKWINIIISKWFKAQAAASCSGCVLLYSSSNLRNLEHVGFSLATVQVFGSHVQAMLKPS